MGRAFSQPLVGVLAVVELHVHCVGDRGGHVVVNHTRQTSRSVAEDRQRQGVGFVFHEVVAQAVGLSAQTVDANRCVGARAFSSDHVVGRVSGHAIVEGTHQDFIRARVHGSELRVATCGEVFCTFHRHFFFEIVQEVDGAEVLFVVDDFDAAIAFVEVVLADDTVTVHCQLECFAIEWQVEVDEQRVHACCAEALVVRPSTHHEGSTVGVLNNGVVGLEHHHASVFEAAFALREHRQFTTVELRLRVLTSFREDATATVAHAVGHQARTVVATCSCVVVAGCRISATSVRVAVAVSADVVVQARLVVTVSVRIVVAGFCVCAAEGSLTAAFAALVQVQARLVVASCTRVVVAGHFIGATCVGVSAAVAARVVVLARLVVAVGVGIKVAGHFVRATEGAFSATLAALVKVQARRVVDGGCLVVVACSAVGATEARCSVTVAHAALVGEVARTIVDGGSLVVVAGVRVNATQARGAVAVAHAALVGEVARAIVDGGSLVVVASFRVDAAEARRAVSTAYTALVELVALTVAVTGRNVGTAALVHVARTSTNTAGVEVQALTVGWIVVVASFRVNAVVHIVTNEVTVHVEETVAVANAQDVDHTHTWVLGVTDAVVVEVTKWARIFAVHDAVVVAVVEAIVTCFFVVAGAVLVHVQAVVFVVANAVGIRVSVAVTAALADGIQFRAFAVAVAGWNV